MQPLIVSVLAAVSFAVAATHPASAVPEDEDWSMDDRAALAETGLAIASLAALKAAAPTDSDAAALAGVISLERDEPERAAPYLETGCDYGNARACHELGLLHFHGNQIESGLLLIEQACDAGIARACSKEGMIYRYAQRGIKRDDGRSLAAFRQACRSGFMPSCYRVGNAYRDGHGTTNIASSDSSALGMYLHACANGEPRACNEAGRIYRKHPFTNSVRAADLYRQACDGGELAGCNNLARSYRDGDGVPRDIARALELHARACEAGSSFGCNQLGRLYQAGEIVEADPGRAAEYFRQACEIGRASACIALGRSYENGNGVPPNRARALDLYRESCADGSVAACDALREADPASVRAERVYTLMLETYRGACGTWDSASECESLTSLLTEACERGDFEACIQAGNKHMRDHGGVERARPLYTRACEAGDLGACHYLARSHYTSCWGGFGCEGSDEARQGAVERWVELCEQGHAPSCHRAGKEFETGVAVRKQPGIAAALQARACDLGDAEGCAWFSASLRTGHGVARDLEAADVLIERSCEMGLFSSCHTIERWEREAAREAATRALIERSDTLVLGCEGGEAGACEALAAVADRFGPNEDEMIEFDRDRARTLWQVACQGGQGEACVSLADSYRKEQALRFEALDLYSAQCSAGHANACTGAGYVLQRSINAPAERFSPYYVEGCERGDAAACWFEGKWLTETEGADIARGAEYLDRACTLGDRRGCHRLGEMLLEGDGVPRDTARARPLLVSACTSRYYYCNGDLHTLFE
ncbi:MAG: tetratricopeptide repeat protein [Oceanicaulis sp.]